VAKTKASGHGRIETRVGVVVEAKGLAEYHEFPGLKAFGRIEATTMAGDVLNGAAQLIVVGDREFDIYSQFARRPPGVELIVRSAQNRKLADEDYLFDAPFDWHELGSKDVRVPPSQPGDAGRVARVSVKAGCVCICRPRNGASPADPANATLTYVEVNETNIMLLLWLNKMCESRSQFKSGMVDPVAAPAGGIGLRSRP
jgi:hypothetical protein